MNTFKLTENEVEVMRILWNAKEPLTKTEITNLCHSGLWSKGSTHSIINNLMKKNVLKVDGIKPTTKNFARTFKPIISLDEYLLNDIKNSYELKNAKYAKFLFAALLDVNKEDESLIEELEKMLDERKRKNKDDDNTLLGNNGNNME